MATYASNVFCSFSTCRGSIRDLAKNMQQHKIFGWSCFYQVDVKLRYALWVVAGLPILPNAELLLDYGDEYAPWTSSTVEAATQQAHTSHLSALNMA